MFFTYSRTSLRLGDLFLTLFPAFVIVLALTSCASIETHKNADDLRSIAKEKSYQVKVRTGNLTLDKIVYEATNSVFGEYLIVNEEDNYSGFIEVVFTSSSGLLPSGHKPAYKTNVIYGNTWFTRDTLLRTQYPRESEIAQGGLFTLQNSKMTVVIKDRNGRILWDAEYTYNAGEKYRDVLVNTADKAATLCLDRIISSFRKDFNLTPASAEVKTKVIPPIALVVKSRWMNTGKNRQGHEVYIDTRTISYPSPDIIRVWTKAKFKHYEYLDLVDINCAGNKFILIEERLDTNPSLSPNVNEWSTITPENTPDLIHKSLCNKQLF